MRWRRRITLPPDATLELGLKLILAATGLVTAISALIAAVTASVISSH
jgi:hypothetical protein